MIISWAWLVFYAIMIIDLTHEGIKHGQKRKVVKYDFWVAVLAKGLMICLIAWIAGGFT